MSRLSSAESHSCVLTTIVNAVPPGLNRVSLNELRQVMRDDLIGIVENALVSLQMGRSASGTMTIGE